MRYFYFISIIILHFILFFLNIFYFLFFNGNLDAGFMLASAKRILEGEIPLRDFFYFQIPGDIFLISFFFKIFGQSFFTAKIMMIFFAILSGFCLTLVLYYITKSKPIIFLFSLFFYINFFSFFQLTHHWLGSFFVIFTMIAFLLGINHEVNFYIFFAGFLGGITLLINETKGLYIILLYFVFLIINSIKYKQFKNIMFFAFGALVILGSYFIFVLITGSLPSYIETLKWALTHYNKLNRYPFLYSEFMYIKYNFVNLSFNDIYYSLYMIFIIVVLLIFPLIISIIFITKYFKKSIHTNKIKNNMLNICIISITYISLFLSALYRPDSQRLITFNSPVALMLLFCVFTELRISILNKPIKTCLINFYYLIFILLIYTHLVLAIDICKSIFSFHRCTVVTENGRMDLPLGYCEDLSKIYSVLFKEAEQEKIFVYHSDPLLYFLLNKKNATSFDIYVPLLSSYQQAIRIISELERNPPKFIIKDTYIMRLQNPNDVLYWQFPGFDRSKLRNDIVDDYIKNRYSVYKILNMYIILKRNF